MIKHQFIDFIGVFEKVLDQNTCQRIIDYFLWAESHNFTLSRQQTDSNVSKLNKDTSTYFLSNTPNAFQENNKEILASSDLWIFNILKESLIKCYDIYSTEYGIFENLSKHTISGCVKIQKTSPTHGYHIWHCENGGIRDGNRLLLAIIYLNDVQEGGETEFLYQSLRIKPKMGDMILCPTGFTHTHRGNPPLKEDKFILNTWIEFIG